MPAIQQLDLATFDGVLLDGLDFCRKVYDLFDQVRNGPDGIARLRLRPEKLDKKLLEELIPIARYVQERYRAGRRIKVRWFSGSQPYDAVFWSSGSVIAHRMEPRRLFVEVTTSSHQNEYLVREAVHKQGGAFGPKSITRERKTRAIVSKPHATTLDERSTDLADQILTALRKKATKNYPPGMALIINCIPDGFIYETDWQAAIHQVEKAQLHLCFREVFLFEMVMGYSKTLCGNGKRPAQDQTSPHRS